MSSERIQGTVKWFSNSKGYGFITPTNDDENDIFVHQSSIHSEGYRTLGDGWTVEFEIVTDENGKMKADNVTAPGGGPCTGPRRRREHRHGHAHDDTHEEHHEDQPARRSSRKKNLHKPRQEWWHNPLSEDVKSSMDSKGIKMTTGTVDISFEGYRIKLGTLGYTSMAHADGILAEGTFSSNEDGLVTFEWQKAIQYHDNEWKPYDVNELIKTLTLTDDAVGTVGKDETAATLWGDGPTDAKNALETNGFQMRRVVLTPKGARGGSAKE